MRGIATTLLLAALLLCPTAAHPAEDAAKAASRALLKQGNERLDQGKYEQALGKFRQAYERFASPKLFFGQGQALAGLGRDLEALTTFQRFLTEAKDASPEHQAEARRQVESLLQKVGRIEVRSNREGARVRLEDKEQGTTPLAGPLFVAPGEHTLRLDWNGEEKSSVVTAAAGPIVVADLAFVPKPAGITLRCNRDGATVRLDGKDVGTTPLAAPLSAAPGEHELVVAYQDETKSARLMAAEGESQSLDLRFADKPVAALAIAPAPVSEPLPAGRAWYRSPWTWGAAGVVVAGVATTLILVYGRRDSYPDTSMGTHPIGD